jgi:hypothetical protein
VDDRNVQFERRHAAYAQQLGGFGLGDGARSGSRVSQSASKCRAVATRRTPKLRR